MRWQLLTYRSSRLLAHLPLEQGSPPEAVYMLRDGLCHVEYTPPGGMLPLPLPLPLPPTP